ncbi:MAG: hydrogen gas-evolving membrane-bound hydrogenase subunit E [Planctomycetota bacterium]
MVVFASILALAFLAVLAPFLARPLGKLAGPVFAAVPLYFFVLYATLLPDVAAGEPLRVSMEWIPQIGLSASFLVDGLGLLFAMLVCGIGSIVVLYASADLKGHPLLGCFYSYLIGFMVSMLGLVLCDNLLLVFIFWELTSITSYLLIGFDHEREAARKSALQALLVTGLGGLLMLAGLVMLGVMGGSFEISEIVARVNAGEVIPAESSLYIPALVFLLAGCLTKSAQFPFHFWLPNAMEAPSPVSAFLHSSTMVKAGVYLLARTNPIMQGTDAWMWTLAIFGGATMFVGAYLATRQTYLKKLLAYSTVSSLGIMVMCLGLGGEYGVKAAIAYLFAHALFKGTLFLIAGTVSHQTGIKDTEKLGMLARAMPLTCVAAVIGALSMAGVPPFNGFAGKELLLKASTHAAANPWLWAAISCIAGAWTVFISWMIAWRVFFGPRATSDLKEEPREAPWTMSAGPLVLSAIAIVAGLMPGMFAEPLIGSTVASVTGEPVSAILGGDHGDAQTAASHAVMLVAEGPGDVAHAGGHGFDLSLGYLMKPSIALALSITAIVLGSLVYFGRVAWRRATDPIAAFDRVGPEAGYRASLSGLNLIASTQTKLLQNGYLSVYLKTCVLALVILGWSTILRASDALSAAFTPGWWKDPTIFEVAVAAQIVLACLTVVIASSRLAAVAVMGVVGYCIAIIFVLFGAPDVAMTQFSIETLTVIIFVLVLYHMPRFAHFSKKRVQFLDATIAIAFGGLMTTLVLIANAEQVITGSGIPAAPISRYFAEASYLEANGKNIVNVILVDFRGIDTMLEVFVLGLAAVGVFTLLTVRSPRSTAKVRDPDGRELDDRENPFTHHDAPVGKDPLGDSDPRPNDDLEPVGVGGPDREEGAA